MPEFPRTGVPGCIRIRAAIAVWFDKRECGMKVWWQDFSMADEKRKDRQSLLEKLIAILLSLPWLEVAEMAWNIIRKVIQVRSYAGMYEVLNYESTLELRDRGGKRAVFKKWEKVRYIQDNVIVYQDQAWGDGEILVNYRCSPGKPSVDYCLVYLIGCAFRP
jgi:hypothetical protein